MNSFNCQDCIILIGAAIAETMHEEAYRCATRGTSDNGWRDFPCKIKLYAHSALGRSHKELDEEEYKKMRVQTLQSLEVINLEAKYTFK